MPDLSETIGRSEKIALCMVAVVMLLNFLLHATGWMYLPWLDDTFYAPMPFAQSVENLTNHPYLLQYAPAYQEAMLLIALTQILGVAFYATSLAKGTVALLLGRIRLGEFTWIYALALGILSIIFVAQWFGAYPTLWTSPYVPPFWLGLALPIVGSFFVLFDGWFVLRHPKELLGFGLK